MHLLMVMGLLVWWAGKSQYSNCFTIVYAFILFGVNLNGEKDVMMSATQTDHPQPFQKNEKLNMKFISMR
jgi:hypothetical protein